MHPNFYIIHKQKYGIFMTIATFCGIYCCRRALPQQKNTSLLFVHQQWNRACNHLSSITKTIEQQIQSKQATFVEKIKKSSSQSLMSRFHNKICQDNSIEKIKNIKKIKKIQRTEKGGKTNRKKLNKKHRASLILKKRRACRIQRIKQRKQKKAIKSMLNKKDP